MGAEDQMPPRAECAVLSSADGIRSARMTADGASATDKMEYPMRLLRRPLFLCVLVIPNLVSLFYFGLLASPVYVSRASLTILNPASNASNLTTMLSGGSGDGSSEGAYILKDYAGSWDAFRRIDRRFDLSRHYRQGDLVSGYGGFSTWLRTNDVALWQYYRNNVQVTVDVKSGIASLAVYGYTPDFAQAVAAALLRDTVAHLNAMAWQQGQDAISDAMSRETALAAAVRKDELALAGYRSRVKSYDPKAQYLSSLSLINDLAARKAEFQTQYDAIRRATPHSPDAGNIAAAMAALQSKIADADRQIAALEKASAQYDTLVARRDNDAALLQQASLSVQQLRQKAAQNRYYLNVISQPSMPHTPELPHRFYWIGGIFLATLLLWGLLR